MIREARFYRRGLIFVLASAALAFISGNAWAQGDQHLPLEKAVISGEGAKKALTRYQISADIARKLVDACVDYAKSTNTPVSVFVLSPDGEIVDAHRMDGQNSINTDTALLKAKTALYLRDSTHTAANRFQSQCAGEIEDAIPFDSEFANAMEDFHRFSEESSQAVQRPLADCKNLASRPLVRNLGPEPRKRSAEEPSVSPVASRS
jgi:hypothetical protein